MLERRELAIVMFSLGLTLVIIGLWGLGASESYDQIAIGAGVTLSVVVLGWWQLLRRS